MYDLIVIGGGAAGFFTAVRLAEQRPDSRILIAEKSNKVLSKVKVSGGGRCNVTHACFNPKDMVEHYPRGAKELLGPFHRFLCGDMMAWLSERGVETKIEEDGRVFPISDSSQTIIDCFMAQVNSHRIEVRMQEGVKGLHLADGHWSIQTTNHDLESRCVMLATGSTPSVWAMLQELGYDIVPPVPSLFTFNIKDQMLEDLQGLSMPEAEVRIPETGYSASGPILITHWGLSGPAVLKCSAWAAKELNHLEYHFLVEVNWIGRDSDTVREVIETMRKEHGKRMAKKYPLFDVPRRLWERFCWQAKLRDDNFGSLTALQMDSLVRVLTCSTLNVNGKSTFKEEFVTCGGVELKQIDFKNMESRLHKGLFMAGEVLNIDAITGGFNFQAAWTEAYVAAEAMAERLSS